MNKRLTNKMANGCYNLVKLKENNDSYKDTMRAVFDSFQRLGALEDLQEQGKLVELPCKVGDKVYFINLFSKMDTLVQEVAKC